jgi:(p)ppGpp synthase/HD superfamily hydrolase
VLVWRDGFTDWVSSELHRDQVRKGSGIPYIAHLSSVSSRVPSAGGTEVQAIAGLLHDAAESRTRDRFQVTDEPFAMCPA